MKLPRRSKYGAKRTVVDGHSFPSKREATRYSELKLMEKNGDIYSLELQPKLPIEVNGKKICTYICDFCYNLNPSGIVVWEDSKGMVTPIYRLKKKLVEALYGIEIVEV